MSLSNYSEELLLDALLGEMPFFVALSSTDPGEDGSTITEPTTGGYARKESSAFSRTDSTIANTAAVTFTEASDSWGDELTYFAIFDADIVGNMIGYALLTSPVTVASGETLQFNTGTLTITAD